MAVRKAPSRPSRITVRAKPSAASGVKLRAKSSAKPDAKARAKSAAKPGAKLRAKSVAKPGAKRTPLPKAKLIAKSKLTAKAKLKSEPAAKRTVTVKKDARSNVAPKRAAKARAKTVLRPAVKARVARPKTLATKAPAPKPSSKKPSPERQFAQHLIDAAQETKAERMLLFDLRGESPITDYVLIASGRSQGHVRGIADKIEQRMKKSGRYARGVEGFSEGSWILLDYDEVIVHLFHPETRLYYDLDSLLKSYPCEKFAEPEERERAADDGDEIP